MKQTLHVSANQWQVSILKACVGVQVARGIAEDISHGCIALLALGQNPLKPLLEALGGFEPGCSSPQWPTDTDTAQLGDLQVLHHGPSLIDMAQAGIVCSCEIDNYPLLLGLAQARLNSHGLRFQFSEDGTEWQDISSVLNSGRALPDSGPVWLRKAQGSAVEPLNLTNLPQPTRDNWAKLQHYADQIMVPADATNRADAGAGLTDND